MESSNSNPKSSMMIWPFHTKMPQLPLLNQGEDNSTTEFLPNNFFETFKELQTCMKKKLDDKKESNDKRLQCEACCKYFKNYKGLKQHMGKIHSIEGKAEACPECNKHFKDKFAVTFHLNQVHKDVKKVRCSQCGMILYNKYMLKKHIFISHRNNF
ncbi:unnamed protein product [Blepharisma stoltei]|uniref:C2H2-type domain-containing protein n=1 Tax=Blepharisma stoltei TaxID=1481888 RepID=A0AAU9K0P1_9CILI|nr:unnamed protein product [Blepharisma stoltei]